MDELIPWFHQQLDDHERATRAAVPSPWLPNGEHDEVVDSDGDAVFEGFALANRQLRATVDYIIRQQPDRTLSSIAADRALLTEYAAAETYFRRNRTAPAGELHGLLTAIKHRAAAYAHQPGYQERWRP